MSHGGFERTLHSVRRYQFAASFLRASDNVLDICCGTGYGTAIMSKEAKCVVGIDVDQSAVEFAEAHYPYCNFIKRDIALHEFNVICDVATMFESLDHFKKDIGKNILGRAAHNCNGIMFLSLPQDQNFGGNPYHLAEWSDIELKAELEKYFSRVVLFGQSWSTGAIAYPYDGRRSITVFVAIK